MWLRLWGGRPLGAFLVMLFALAVALPSWAAPKGQLRVTVVDQEMQLPVPGANAELSGAPLLGGVQVQFTDQIGEVLFRDLPPGVYRLAISRAGFRGVVLEGLQVNANRTTQHAVALLAGQGEEISVSARLRAVDTESTATGQVLTKDFLQRIPEGRAYQSAIQTVPGVTNAGGNPNMAGVTSNENTYILEPPPTAQLRGPPPPEKPQARSRMVHYDGWVALSVPDPRETTDAVMRLAEEAGGRVEQTSGTVVSVRVPVASFKEIWEKILALGESIDQLVRAEDVTDQHTATELRRDVLQATRERLVALLAMAKTESEKLRLLAEISRITEQLDVIEAQLRTLSDLAAMSRITVELVPSQSYVAQGANRVEAAGMEWISRLSPFRRGPWDDEFRIELSLPNQMVALSDKGPFVAESPGGTVWWTMRLPNNPRGSATFWADTLKDRLGSEFAEVARPRRGNWDCLILNEPGAKEPYRWDICVQNVGDFLHVSQTYYPNPAQIERYSGVIERLMSAGGGGT